MNRALVETGKEQTGSRISDRDTTRQAARTTPPDLSQHYIETSLPTPRHIPLACFFSHPAEKFMR